jgi:MacB-like periplasmic core domain
MDLLDLVIISLRTLAKNKLRSGLTVLGIVIGIAAVTTMVSLGQSGSALVQAQFQNLGSNVIIVLPASSQTGGVRSGTVTTLTEGDSDAIVAECPSVLAASPFIGASGQVIGGNVNWQPDQMLGVGPDYPIVRSSPLVSGEFFTQRDIAAAAKVCVLGYTVARQLFPDADPVGQQVRVKNIPFTVIGLLARKGADLGGRDQDNVLLMPFTTVRKRLQNSGFNNIDLIFLSARSESQSFSAEKEIRSLLTERHRIPPGEKPDFEVRNTAEVAAVLTAIMGGLGAVCPDAHGHRGHLARGGRRGDYEHHAGIGHGADARDRHPHGVRRPTARHPATISGGIGGVVERRRGHRHGDGSRGVGRRHRFAQRLAADRKMVVPGVDPGHDHRAVVRGGGRHLLRLLPGATGEPARPD